MNVLTSSNFGKPQSRMNKLNEGDIT